MFGSRPQGRGSSTIQVNSHYPPQGLIPLGGGPPPPEEAIFYEAQFPAQEDLSFSFYKFYQINTGQVPSTETDYPLRIHDTLGAGVFQGQFDLEIFDEEGVKLTYEREFINETTGEFAIWVDVLTVQDGKFFQLNVGKAGVVIDPSQNAFNANYKRVHHLIDLSGKDSSVNDSEAVSEGNIKIQNGSLGPEVLFNDTGTATGLFDGDATGLPEGDVNRTISVIIKSLESFGSGINALVHMGDLSGTTAMFIDREVNDLLFGDVGVDGQVVNGALPLDEYIHLVYTYESIFNVHKLFIDGSEISSFINSSNVTIEEFNIGADESDNEKIRNAILKEVRVLDITQSANTIAIDFNNQRENDTFFNQSPLIPTGTDVLYEDNAGNLYIKNQEGLWAFKVELNVLAAKVAGTQPAFPVLVYVSAGSDLANELIGKSAFDDGHDIRPVILEDEEIPYELVSFDNATGELLMFVSSDINDSSGGTFDLLFGNPVSGASKSDGSTVFLQYLAVYHMQDIPLVNGTLIDSTGINNGTFSNVLSELPDQVSGTNRPKALQFNVSSSLQFATIPDPIGAAFDSNNKCSVFADTTADAGEQADFFAPIVGQSNTDTSTGLRWSLIKRNTVTDFLGAIFSGLLIIGADFLNGARILGGVQKDMAADKIDMFAAGLLSSTTIDSNTIQAATTSGRIGASGRITTPDLYKGKIQEIRLATTQFSDDYILTDFNNQDDPSLFYNVDDPLLVNTPANWGDTDFPRRIPKIINAGQVPSAQTDLPLLIEFPVGSDEANSLAGNVQNEGQDIRVFLDDKTPIPFEIEKINSGTGELILWCKPPTTKDGTIIYVNFGNPTAGDIQDPAGVFGAYGAVFHMNQANPLLLVDSTGNGNTPTVVDGTPATETPAKIGDGISFDSTPGDAIQFSHSSTIHPQPFISISAWVKPTNDGTVQQIFSHDGSLLDRVWQFRKDASNKIQFIVFNELGANNNAIGTTDLFASGNNHLVHGTWDGTTIRVYVDGVEEGTTLFSGTNLREAPTDPVSIGRSMNVTPGFWDGLIDEPRVTNEILTADKILTESNNQDDPTAFFLTQKVEILSP